ncbi:MAG: TonB-dependent siderophore receptor [Ramlibacter sp.]|nr:TonB-dependent siderophore receptor [Ramlibacter sp.]
MLAGSLGAFAQTTPPPATRTLPTVEVREKAEGRDAVRATTTTIGKGEQQLRDIPQSITVVTEKLMDDRNLDTVKEALKNTAGITFLAAEGGEEDIRLRGFSLSATGDIFVDGMRDPAFYERDTFSLDRLELLRGSASMLFGRGSTGGAVNQVNKVPRLIDEHQVDLTLGSHNHRRLVGDFNIKTGESAALRINAMTTTADNNGAGTRLDKRGIAASYRFGIGERNEFLLGLYHLDNRNGMNYGLPWIRRTLASPVSDTTLLPLDPTAYYGMASDRNYGSASYGTFAHTHRFDGGSELKTQLRKGVYTRDQRASTVRFGNAASQPGGIGVSLDTFGPNTVLTRGAPLKIQDLDTTFLQSDFSAKFTRWGMKHAVQAGVDLAQERKVVRGQLSVLQGGVVPTKPTTTVGTPFDGAWINEDSRILRDTSRYQSTAWGVYAQDLVQVAPHWKVLAGLRYDSLVGDYETYAIPNNASGPVTTTPYRMKIGEWSKRLGVLYQPNDLHSFHVSAANSFNTSGDAYSLSAANQNIPPEQSVNLELGARLDSADRRFTTRLAWFRSTKLHERNTDPLLPGVVTLSGKRHTVGAEADITGRLTPKWEIYGSYMYLPIAKIDIGSVCPAPPANPGECTGTRPSLTPKHSGTIWSTYQLTPQWRVGGGINFRSSQTPNRNPGFEVPGYFTGDLMAEFRVNDQFTLKANLTNVTNRLYADQLYSGHYIPGAGRVFQLTGSLSF